MGWPMGWTAGKKWIGPLQRERWLRVVVAVLVSAAPAVGRHVVSDWPLLGGFVEQLLDSAPLERVLGVALWLAQRALARARLPGLDG